MVTDLENYLFDLRGYLIVRGALTSEEVANGNEAKCIGGASGQRQ